MTRRLKKDGWMGLDHISLLSSFLHVLVLYIQMQIRD